MLLTIAAAAAVILLTSTASATRTATRAERSAILSAAADAWQGTPPRCLLVRVSTVSGRYASVGFRPVRSCARYGANGLTIVHHVRGGWVDVYDGSDAPGCSRIPPAVTRDLFRARCLR